MLVANVSQITDIAEVPSTPPAIAECTRRALGQLFPVCAHSYQFQQAASYTHSFNDLHSGGKDTMSLSYL